MSDWITYICSKETIITLNTMSKTNNYQTAKHDYVAPTFNEIIVRVESGFAATTGSTTDMPSDKENNPW